MSASFASGARVVVTSADHVIPKGTRGTVTKVYGSKVGVQWDNGMETDFPADALAIVAETPEETGNRAPTVDEQFLRLKAEFDARDAAQNPANQLREAMEAARRIGVVFPTDAGVPGKHPALDGETDLHGPVSPALRDLVRSQSLAMASAETRLGVATAAWGIACAASGDALLGVVKRSLREVVGDIVDLFDGLDVDTLAKRVFGAVATPPASETVTVGVMVDGKTVGTVTVPVAADEAAVIASLRADPLFMAKLPGEVASVAYIPGKVVRITTKAAPSPATESAPSE